MKFRTEPSRHPEAVEIELIRSLFHTLQPSIAMTVSFVAAGSLIYVRTGDANLLLLLIVGTIASIARLLACWLLGPAIMREDVTLPRALRLEQYFGLPYLSFAALLGAFGYRALQLPYPDVHMLVVALLMSYCAGVAVGLGLRLRIAISSMVLALLPAIVSALLHSDLIYKVCGAVLTTIMASGIQTLRARKARSMEDIGLRLTFAQLARKDALTALPNRIALREWFERRVTAGREDSLIAVHYLDLNGFKPVNDLHGHPVGDELLTAIGKRIAHTIRATDIVARIGGDEFAVVQHGLNAPEEAAQLAARLREAISRPFRIRSLTLNISTGLGFVVSRGKDVALDDLLSLADKALYTSKSSGEVTQFSIVGR